jgi:hypothetical protein
VRRVIQFSTGNVGRHALRTIIGRPDLELVGVHANRAQKVGRDAAELCGLDEPSGVVATDDVNALVALIATAARAVNMIEPVCAAPSGLLAVQDLPAAHIRGVVW